MDVLVTGSSGFIGSALLPALTIAGHRPIRAVRGRPARGVDEVAWDPEAGTVDRAGLEGVGAVVHLAGAGIGDRRWSEARKREILESRTRGTRLIAETIASLDPVPAVMVSGSAVGYYGSRGDTPLDETSTPGDGFLAQVCQAWEAATEPAGDAGVRVVNTRSGIVLGRNGGVLHKMLLPFRLGLGGRIGDGRQWTSWISLVDEVRAILHALETDGLTGPVNLSAPEPVTNLDFTRALGRALHRPTVLPTPLPILRAVYGSELVGELLNADQRVLPRALEVTGFEFEHPTIDEAFAAILGTKTTA